MEIAIKKNAAEIGQAAGKLTAGVISNAIRQNGQANIILATGESQFETLKQLVRQENIDYSKVVMFHLDEYIGLPETAAATFRKYLQERFLYKVAPLKAVYLIDGENDPVSECDRLNDLIARYPIDVALVGIGENGHLAFNDPPADFDTEKPYRVVELDEACRKQQLAEGWFQSLAEVPENAISMSVKQIMKSKKIICSVPGSRKAKAVKDCMDGSVSNLFPASILQLHPDCSCFLDSSSAALLSIYHKRN